MSCAGAYRERPAPPDLSPWAACVWELSPGDEGSAHRVLPDGCMDLVWSDERGLTAVGANTTAFVAELPPGAGALGVRLHPGGAPPLFGVPGEALRDASPPAAELWGPEAERLAERIRGTDGPVARTALMLDWLARRARAASPPDALVRAVARRLDADPRAPIAVLAREAGVGERHLRRRVVREVGYGPRRLARVLRLQRTVALATGEPAAGLAEIAFRAGYADQSHLSHEVRDLAGLTPSALLAG